MEDSDKSDVFVNSLFFINETNISRRGVIE